VGHSFLRVHSDFLTLGGSNGGYWGSLETVTGYPSTQRTPVFIRPGYLIPGVAGGDPHTPPGTDLEKNGFLRKEGKVVWFLSVVHGSTS